MGERAFILGLNQPQVADLCDAEHFCLHEGQIAEAVEHSFNEWSKYLGCCLICCHFLRPDFANTPS